MTDKCFSQIQDEERWSRDLVLDFAFVLEQRNIFNVKI
jgi:hypothetical protein